MSINGVDYSKQLAKDREYYQDANKKLRDSTEKRVDDTNKRADYAIDKQRDNFIKDKAELETHYQKGMENLKEKTRASLEDSNSSLKDGIEKERQNFTQESLKKSKDFDQRLNDIKSSYAKAFDSEHDRHNDLQKTAKNKYSTNVNNIRKNSDEKLQEYQDKMTSTGAGMKDQYNRERQQLVRAQEDRLTEAYRDSSQKRAELKDHITNENKKMKDVHAAELEQIKDYTGQRLMNTEKRYADHFDTMSRDYSDKNDNLVKSQQENAVKQNREQQNKVADMQRGFNDSLRKIDLDKKRSDNGSGDFKDVVARQQGLKDQTVHNNKMKRTKEELVNAQKKYESRAIKEHEGYRDTLKAQSSEATAFREKKVNELNADKILTVANERDKREKEVQIREKQNRTDKAAYEGQLINERNAAKTRLNTVKANFNSSMKALEEKQQAAMEDVTKTSNDDKNEFMTKVQENRTKEIFDMKRAFNKVMDATVQDYEQRLSTFQRENEYLKLSMEQKVENIIDQTDKKIESQTKLFEDRRAADVRSKQIMMDQREASLKRNFSEMNINYQKKIDKLMIESDSKLKLITNDYETKLKELKATTSKDLAQKDTNQQLEMARIKQTFEDEKSRLISGYENQIETMKTGHEEAMRQMAEYKRLT